MMRLMGAFIVLALGASLGWYLRGSEIDELNARISLLQLMVPKRDAKGRFRK